LNIKDKIPQYVLDIARILAKEGYEAYLVGGSVRDILMDRTPHDYDIATDARPEVITKIFPKAITTGAKFGSVIVMVKDERSEPQPVDVTTYRVEEYRSGRWPSKVDFISSIEGDLARRDFTVNAMAINLVESTGDDAIFDPFGGQEDLEKKVIRAVGDPKERFREDALRVLRACRFASVLGFDIEPKTKEAIGTVLTMVDDLSAERIREEFLKMIKNSPKPSIGIRLMADTGILKIWIPELLEGRGVEQPEFHHYDVFEHALRTIDRADDSVKLAALFHDIGKPHKKQGAHFYGHDLEGEKMTKQILERLRFSKKEIKRTSKLVRWHMFYFPYDEEDFEKGKKIIRKTKSLGKWSDAAIRRFVRNVGGEEAIDDLMKLRIADATANPKGSFDEQELVALQKRIGEVREKDMALKVADLDIKGKDLIKMGIKPSPRMGKILNELLEMVIEDPTVNDKERLIEIVRENYLR
jgi:tRNA nucleotidyltransferase (CCA-adding enzyme)